MMHKKNNFCKRYAVRSGLIMMFQQDLETLPREELKELQQIGRASCRERV